MKLLVSDKHVTPNNQTQIDKRSPPLIENTMQKGVKITIEIKLYKTPNDRKDTPLTIFFLETGCIKSGFTSTIGVFWKKKRIKNSRPK